MPKPPPTVTARRVRRLADAVTLPTARERLAAVVGLLDGWHFWGTAQRARLAHVEVAACCGPAPDWWPRDLERRRDGSRLPRTDLWNAARREWMLARPVCDPQDHATEADLKACPVCSGTWRPVLLDAPPDSEVHAALDRLAALGYVTVEHARRAQDRASEAGHPCRHGHESCALERGGPCLGEVWPLLALLEAAGIDDGLTCDPGRARHATA